MPLPTFILAPDKFKCTLTADEAAQAMHEGITTVYPEAVCISIPMADGGEGTAKILAGDKSTFSNIESLSHEGINITVPVYCNNAEAWVDTADIVGMKLTRDTKPHPLDYTTRPLGKLLTRLLDRFDSVTLCVGGTATVDAGAGMLQALGARFYDKAKHAVNNITMRDFTRVANIDLSDVDINLLSSKIQLIVDVDVPLVGTGMSSLDFASQKGVEVWELDYLEKCLQRYSALLQRGLLECGNKANSTPGGAGGGIEAFFNMIGCNRQLGSHLMAQRLLARAAVVENPFIITGEGCFDEQSIAGKITGTIISESQNSNIPVAIIAGRVSPSMPTSNNVQILPLTDITEPVPDPKTSYSLIKKAAQNLAANLR